MTDSDDDDAFITIEATSTPQPSTNTVYYRCDKCSYQTRIQHLLDRHVAKHDLGCPEMVDCSMCEFSSNYVNSMKHHIEVFHTKIHRCEICDKVMTKHMLIKHVQRFHKEETQDPKELDPSSDTGLVLESASCSSAQKNRAPEAPHVEVENEPTESIKTGCVSPDHAMETPTSENGLGRPLARDLAEPSSSSKEFKCSNCSYIAGKRRHLFDHVTAFHTKKYHCNQCPVIMTKHELIEHCRVVHGRTLPFNCRLKAAIKHGNRVIGEVSQDQTESDALGDGVELLVAPASSKSTLNTTEAPDVEMNEPPVPPGLAVEPSEPENDLPDPSLWCSMCAFTTQNQLSLKYHIVVFHKKKVKCDHCSLVLTRHDLSLHIAKQHPVPTGPEDLEPKDSQSERSNAGGTTPPLAHDAPEHSTAIEEFKCSQCSYSGTVSGNLVRHVLAFHTKKYHCNQCPAIMTKHEFVEHYRVVHGKTMKVSRGRFSFKAASEDVKTVAVPLQQMSRRSGDDRGMAGTTNCPFCDHASSRVMDVEGHISRMHTMKYSCMYCSEIMTKYEIIIHSKEVHGVKVGKSLNTLQKVRSGSDLSANDAKKPRVSKRSRKFACIHCKFSSLSVVGLREHKERFHKRNSNKRRGVVTRDARVSRKKPVPSKKLRRRAAPIAADAEVSSKNEPDTGGRPGPLKAEADVVPAPTVASEEKDQGSFDCPSCEFKTPLLKRLRNHKVNFHRKIFRCDFCSAEMTKCEVIEHAKEKHGVSMTFLEKAPITDSKIGLKSSVKTPSGSGHQLTSPSPENSSRNGNVLNHPREKLWIECPVCHVPIHPASIKRHMIHFHPHEPENRSGGERKNIGWATQNVKMEERIHGPEATPHGEIAKSLSAKIAVPPSENLTTELIGFPTPGEVENPLPEVVRLNDSDKIAAGDAESITNASVTSESKVAPSKITLNTLNLCEPKLQVHDSHIIKPMPIPDVKQNEVHENPPSFDIPKQEIALSEDEIQTTVAESNSRSQSWLLQCHNCSYKTRSKSLMRRHAKLHLPEGQFLCPKCDFRDSGSCSFVKHLTSHDLPGAEMKCCFCSFTTSRLCNMTTHMCIHRPVKTYYCSKCEFSTAQNCSLNSHYKRRHLYKYACPLCPKVAAKSIISHHFKKCHPKFNLKDLGGFRAAAQPKHMRKTSSGRAQKRIVAQAFRKKVSRQELKCKTCTFKTLRGDLLQRHEAKHDPLECPVCDMKVSEGYMFTVHLSQHNPREAPFKCFFCGDIAKHIGDLYRHLSLHLSTLKTHDCALCEFSSLRRDYLELHMSTHSKKYTMLKAKAPLLKMDFSGSDQGKFAKDSKSPTFSDVGSGSLAGPSKQAYQQSTSYKSQGTQSMLDPRLPRPGTNLENLDNGKPFPTHSIAQPPASTLHPPRVAESSTEISNTRLNSWFHSMPDRITAEKDMMAKSYIRPNLEWATGTADGKASACAAAPRPGTNLENPDNGKGFPTHSIAQPPASTLHRPRVAESSTEISNTRSNIWFHSMPDRITAEKEMMAKSHIRSNLEWATGAADGKASACAAAPRKGVIQSSYFASVKPQAYTIPKTPKASVQSTAETRIFGPNDYPGGPVSANAAGSSEHSNECSKDSKTPNPSRQYCPDCLFWTHNKDLYERHIDKHKPLICPICCSTITDHSQFTAHLVLHNPPNVPYLCYACGIVHDDQDTLLCHLASKHIPALAKFDCVFCDHSFTEADGLKSHISNFHWFSVIQERLSRMNANRSALETRKPVPHASEPVPQTSKPGPQTTKPDPKRVDKPGQQLDIISRSPMNMGHRTTHLGEMKIVGGSVELKQVIIRDKVTRISGAGLDPMNLSLSNATSVSGPDTSTPGTIRKPVGAALLPTGSQFNPRTTSQSLSANLRTLEHWRKLWIPEPSRPDDPKWLAIAKYGSNLKDFATSATTSKTIPEISDDAPSTVTPPDSK